MNLTEDEIAKLKDERYRGNQAQQVFDNPVFRDACLQIRQKCIDKWQRLPIEDKEGQHFIRIVLAAHDSIVALLEQTMKTGQMAEISLRKNPFRKPRNGQKDDE